MFVFVIVSKQMLSVQYLSTSLLSYTTRTTDFTFGSSRLRRMNKFTISNLMFRFEILNLSSEIHAKGSRLLKIQPSLFAARCSFVDQLINENMLINFQFVIVDFLYLCPLVKLLVPISIHSKFKVLLEQNFIYIT